MFSSLKSNFPNFPEFFSILFYFFPRKQRFKGDIERAQGGKGKKDDRNKRNGTTISLYLRTLSSLRT